MLDNTLLRWLVAIFVIIIPIQLFCFSSCFFVSNHNFACTKEHHRLAQLGQIFHFSTHLASCHFSLYFYLHCPSLYFCKEVFCHLNHLLQFWSKRSLCRRLAAANVVTTIFGIFLLFSFLFSFLFSYHHCFYPRRDYRRILNFCMGS